MPISIQMYCNHEQDKHFFRCVSLSKDKILSFCQLRPTVCYLTQQRYSSAARISLVSHGWRFRQKSHVPEIFHLNILTMDQLWRIACERWVKIQQQRKPNKNSHRNSSVHHSWKWGFFPYIWNSEFSHRFWNVHGSVNVCNLLPIMLILRTPGNSGKISTETYITLLGNQKIRGILPI